MSCDVKAGGAAGQSAQSPTIETVWRAGARRLADAGVEPAGLDARLLLGHVLKLDQAGLIVAGHRRVGSDEARQYEKSLIRRAHHEPVSRIIGVREFFSREFHISAQVLDPRADSECLVETALRLAGHLPRALRLLDLGTGSGCLLVTLLAELPQASGVGIDISASAVAVARRNAARHGVASRAGFAVSDWAQAVAGSFDMIVTNPPYIDRDAIEGLAPEVRDFDPRRALDGGVGGFDAIRNLAPAAARLLRPGASLLVEISHGQAKTALGILVGHGFAPLAGNGVGKDLAGRERVLSLHKT